MSIRASQRGHARRDARWSGMVLTAAGVLLGGWLIQWAVPALHAPWSGDPSAQAAPPDPKAQPAAHADDARAREVKQRFEQAVAMLHARQYEHAVTALHRVIELAPGMPEAHVNMGYALMGLARHDAARDFFSDAIDLQPEQANAYYGLALSLERLGDLEGARGAMRTYLHLARHETDHHLAKARAALWEWEAATSQPAASAPHVRK
jgi:Flp pilus assembly protein TadD